MWGIAALPVISALGVQGQSQLHTESEASLEYSLSLSQTTHSPGEKVSFQASQLGFVPEGSGEEERTTSLGCPLTSTSAAAKMHMFPHTHK